MSFHRVMIAAVAALFVAGTVSVASAGCGGCVPVIASSGCGGCGTLTVTYAPCIVYAPPAFAPAPPPVVPAPIAVDHWDTRGWAGCGCGSCGYGSVLYAPAAAPAPLFVVNQGPEYSGPGVMVRYRTYAPEANLAAPYDYPYISHGHGYRHGYWRGHRYWHAHRYAYGHRFGYPHRPDHRRSY